MNEHVVCSQVSRFTASIQMQMFDVVWPPLAHNVYCRFTPNSLRRNTLLVVWLHRRRQNLCIWKRISIQAVVPTFDCGVVPAFKINSSSCGVFDEFIDFTATGIIDSCTVWGRRNEVFIRMLAGTIRKHMASSMSKFRNFRFTTSTSSAGKHLFSICFITIATSLQLSSPFKYIA